MSDINNLPDSRKPRTPVGVDDISKHPTLYEVNWTPRFILAMMRGGLIGGFQDGGTKARYTCKEDVAAALDMRNKNLLRSMIPLEDFLE